MAPRVGDRCQSEVEFGRAQDFDALGIGLHETVFDTVVDHLDEVTSAAVTGVHEAAFGWGEVLQQRRDVSKCVRWTARHESESLASSPDPAADTDVEKRESARVRLLGVALGIPKVRVAAVDDNVDGGECCKEL